MKNFSKRLATLALVVGSLALAGCASNPHGTGGKMGGVDHGPGQACGMMEMHDHMQKMNETMREMRQTQSPEEKEKMMQAHMQDMEKHMAMMRKRMKCGACANDMGEMQQECKMMKGSMKKMMEPGQMRHPAAPAPQDSKPLEPQEEHSHDHSQE